MRAGVSVSTDIEVGIGIGVRVGLWLGSPMTIQAVLVI